MTLEELYVIANSIQIKEHNHMRNMGAIQGVEIPSIEDATVKQEPADDFRARIEEKARTERESSGKAPSGMIGTGYQQI